ETEIDCESVQSQLVGPPIAAQQRAEAELDIELVDAGIALVEARTDVDATQSQRRRRQQPRIDRALDADRQADDAGRLRLALRAEPAPVDEVRSDQGREQREDKGNRNSEQRRLHGLSEFRLRRNTPPTSPRPAAI